MSSIRGEAGLSKEMLLPEDVPLSSFHRDSGCQAQAEVQGSRGPGQDRQVISDSRVGAVTWTKILKTFLRGFALPFVLLGIFLDMVGYMRESDSQKFDHEWSDGDGG